MKKYIYIIKNYCNNKVYIGQTNNLCQRWSQHKSNARRNSTFSLIDEAIRNFGEDNFFYEVIEETEDYDEREIYWINQYNSITPNGYNVLKGDVSVQKGVEHIRSSFRTNEELQEVIKEILETNKSFNDISSKYGVSVATISGINTGRYYRDSSLEYPLRKKKLDIGIVYKIKDTLKNNKDMSIRAISEKYQVDQSTICEINAGRIYADSNIKYPIRTGKAYNRVYYMVDDIIKDLSETEMQMKDIARKYGVSKSQISSINLGSSYRKDTIKYPIRITYEQSKLKVDETLRQVIIEEILKGEKTCKKIAKDFGVSYYTVLSVKNRMS